MDCSTKKELYADFIEVYRSLILNEHNAIGVMANTTALIKETFDFFWIGFYIVDSGELVLGPFQGSTACFRIKKGRGVCGTAWDQGKTLVVDDVTTFPGHIACNALSRSEIVVPVIHKGTVTAVLDIDSDRLNAFDEVDRQGLEKAMRIMAETIYPPTT